MYYMRGMSMGTRKRDRQPTLWVTTTELPTSASHPFYRRLNELLREHGSTISPKRSARVVTPMGRPTLPPGIYFRLRLIGYFEGIDSERGIAWRAADSLALRGFLGEPGRAAAGPLDTMCRLESWNAPASTTDLITWRIR